MSRLDGTRTRLRLRFARQDAERWNERANPFPHRDGDRAPRSRCRTRAPGSAAPRARDVRRRGDPQGSAARRSRLGLVHRPDAGPQARAADADQAARADARCDLRPRDRDSRRGTAAAHRRRPHNAAAGPGRERDSDPPQLRPRGIEADHGVRSRLRAVAGGARLHRAPRADMVEKPLQRPRGGRAGGPGRRRRIHRVDLLTPRCPATARSAAHRGGRGHRRAGRRRNPVRPVAASAGWRLGRRGAHDRSRSRPADGSRRDAARVPVPDSGPALDARPVRPPRA